MGLFIYLQSFNPVNQISTQSWTTTFPSSCSSFFIHRAFSSICPHELHRRSLHSLSRILVDTFSLDSHLGIVNHYCSKVAPWQERW